MEEKRIAGYTKFIKRNELRKVDLFMGKKKGLKVGIALAAGAGAVYAAKNYKKADNKKKIEKEQEETSDYRNTERGKNAKNSKGIYYSNGNYEAFARPKKP